MDKREKPKNVGVNNIELLGSANDGPCVHRPGWCENTLKVKQSTNFNVTERKTSMKSLFSFIHIVMRYFFMV